MQRADAAPCVLSPAKLAPMPASNRSRSLLRKKNPSSAFNRGTEETTLIYVVDDEPRLTDLYTIILEAKGYFVRSFSNRTEALAELKGATRKPDLLIMDYLGHAMSIDRFMQLCLQAHPSLRILVASGFSQMDARFSHVRPDRFLQKPFTAEEFLREVEAALAV
jgi:DNA-binding NtrC family response regulator